MIQSLLGRKGSLVCGVFLAMTGAIACVATPAIAAIFDSGERVGPFDVVGGHVRQHVNYEAKYKRTRGCWTYNYSDTGAADFNLTFDQGPPVTLKASKGTLNFSDDLRVSGTASRDWAGTVEPTRNEDADCDPAEPTPPHPGGCGPKVVEGAFSYLFMALMKNGAPLAPAGHDTALYGSILRDDPLAPCPSASSYGLFLLPAASRQGAEELDEATIGDKVRLGGKDSVNAGGPAGFNVPFDWVSGTQRVDVDWALKLKRVKRGD